MDRFEFENEIPIDARHTLLQLSHPFKFIETGLPEAIKNAKDHYFRVKVEDETDRVVIVFVNTTTRSIGVMDFAGATSKDLALWKTFSHMSANRAHLSSNIEGGHGNGGKFFMVRGCESSTIESCHRNKRTKRGFINDEEHLFRPLYYVQKDGTRVVDFPVEDSGAFFQQALKKFHTSPSALPQDARDVFAKRGSFTLVHLTEMSDWSGKTSNKINKIIHKMVDDLLKHPQAALTLETCSVWVVVDGLLLYSKPLKRKSIKPLPNFSNIPSIPVPDMLPHPDGEGGVSTGPGDEKTRYLKLYTSQKNLRTGDSKPINMVRVKNDRNTLASLSISELVPQAESAYVFGDLVVPGLTSEHVKGSDRTDMSNYPLVLALKTWVTDHIQSLCRQIQRHNEVTYKPGDTQLVNEFLREARKTMAQVLTPHNGGQPGDIGVEPGGIVRKTVPRTRGSVVTEIEVESKRSQIKLATGTRIPIKVCAYEVRGTTRYLVDNPGLEFGTDSPDVVTFIPGFGVKCSEQGRFRVWFEEPESGLRSNEITVESITCRGVRLEHLPDEIKQNEKISLRVAFITDSGDHDDLMAEAYVTSPDISSQLIGSVNRAGEFRAGYFSGRVVISVRFGEGQERVQEFESFINMDVVEKGKTPDGKGLDGLPVILVAGSVVPGREGFPKDLQTVMPDPEAPTIIDYHPRFENIIFINPSSAESRQIMKGKGGLRGSASIGNKMYCEFLSLKLFEIMKHLKVRQDNIILEGDQIRDAFMAAEIVCAPFIGTLFDLAKRLGGKDGKSEYQTTYA